MAWGFGTAAGISGLYGAGCERHAVQLRHVDIALPDLPPALEGYRIGHATDLHRGFLVSEAFLAEALNGITRLSPDLILVTGDLVHRSARYAESCGRALAQLSAPDGVYAVWGNHDHWTREIDAVRNGLRGSGLRILENESVRMERQGTSWDLCGVDSFTGGRPDLSRTVRNAGPGFRLLMAHEPDVADQAGALDISLQLSGHSHGGQVRLPSFGAPLLPPLGRKYPYGLAAAAGGRTQVYTSAGLGVVFPPIRLNCPPEIALITLRRAAA